MIKPTQWGAQFCHGTRLYLFWYKILLATVRETYQEIIRNRTWRMFISNYFTVFSNRTMSNFACKSSYTEMNLAYSFNCFNFLWSLCTFFSSKSIFLLTVCKERLAITQNEHTVLLEGAWRGSLSFDFKGPPDRTSFISPSIIPSFSCFLSPLLDSYNSKVVL